MRTSPQRAASTPRAALVPIALLGLFFCLQASPQKTYDEGYDTAAQPIRLQDYPARLHRLHSLVDQCARTLTTASCDWKLVGPDAAIQLSSGSRRVELAWLRSALKNPSAPKLRDAALFLDQMLDQMSAQTLAQQAEVPKIARKVASERAALKNILASGGYAQEVPPTLFERLRGEFLSWLLRRLNAIGASQGSELIVDLLLISLIVVTCGAMIWWFARKVQSQRLMLTPAAAPHPSAPSAQDWQKWLDQGRSFAREQQWREAIHHVYWSAISRLESRGLWPADGARTPREYLSLLAARPETRADLDRLTRSFERTWYGDQAAGAPEFDQACAMLERLGRS